MMKTIHLLHNLSQFFSLLKRLKDESATTDVELISYVKSQYRFITLEIKGRPENRMDAYEDLLVKITYEREQERILLKEVYFVKDSLLEKCNPLIKAHADTLSWNDTTLEEVAYWSKEVIGYLESADEIAQIGYSCEGGGYAPGYYSEVIVMETSITLVQLNYKNSRSIDHKNDYYLRDLKFIIPVSGAIISKDVYGAVRFRNMLVYFEDRSSANRKECGNLIKAKIQEVELRYK